jgi:hypothetical protein
MLATVILSRGIIGSSHAFKTPDFNRERQQNWPHMRL